MSPENPSELTPEEKAIAEAETPQAPVELPVLSAKELKAQRIEKGLALVEKLNALTLPFPGIPTGIMSDLVLSEEEYPGYTKPISEKFEKFIANGIKIVTGNHPRSGNIFVLPANMPTNAANIEDYSILVQQLDSTNVENPDLKELIELFRKK